MDRRLVPLRAVQINVAVLGFIPTSDADGFVRSRVGDYYCRQEKPYICRESKKRPLYVFSSDLSAFRRSFFSFLDDEGDIDYISEKFGRFSDNLLKRAGQCQPIARVIAPVQIQLKQELGFVPMKSLYPLALNDEELEHFFLESDSGNNYVRPVALGETRERLLKSFWKSRLYKSSGQVQRTSSLAS
ncbi:MAG: hypothetical protein AABX73_00220 [Nanoarchaeota archaeon]